VDVDDQDSGLDVDSSLASLASLLVAVARTPRVPPLLPGVEIADRYLVTGVIGAGGMGVVYRALDRQLGREVALKLCSRVGEDEALHIFGEATALARLSHPNVITVYEIGRLGEDLFLVMELVTGSTLRRWTAAAPRRWRDVLRVYLDAGRGLSAVHRAGLVHGDFKPDNVLVGRDGRVRLVDFGLARTDGDAVPGERAGGTPRYMAPELRAGWLASQRSDQYAYCVALAEGLAGCRRRPPRDVARVVGRGLLEEPARRHDSMDELRRALVGRLARRGRSLAAATVLLIAAAVIAGTGWLGRRAADAEAREAQAAQATLERNLELGRREMAAGNTPEALVYLSAALEGGMDRPAVRFLLARGLAALERTFVELPRPAHAPVTAATLLRAGPQVVIGDRAGQVQLFAIDGGLLRSFNGHTAAITSLAVDPAGRRIAAAAGDGRVIVWDLVSGTRTAELSERAPAGVRFAAESERLVTFGPDGARVWDAGGKELLRLPHPGAVAAAQAAAGAPIITAGEGGARLWHPSSGAPLGQRPGPTVTAFDTDAGGRIALGSADGDVRVWDARGTLLAELRHPERVSEVRLLGDRLLTGCDDGLARLWEVAGAQVDVFYAGHTGPITGLRLAGTEKERLVTSSLDATARVWDLASGRSVALLTGHTEGVAALAVADSGDLVVTGSDDGTARLWTVATEELIGSLPAGTRLTGAWFAGDDQVVGLRDDGAVVVHHARGAAWQPEEKPLRTGLRDARSVAVSGDGERLALVVDGTLELWDLDRREVIARHKAVSDGVAFSRDGTALVTYGGVFHFFDGIDGHVRGSGSTRSPSTLAALSPSGVRLVLGRRDRMLTVFDPVRGEELNPLPAPTGRVVDAVYDPTGAFLAVGASDATVSLVRGEGVVMPRILGRHRAPVQAVRFSPDGALLYSLGADRRVRVWDVAGGVELAALAVDGFAGLEVSPDGTRLLVRSHQGGVSFWDVGREPRSATAIATVVACLAPFQLDESGRLVPRPIPPGCPR